jgi:hypothetical protein
MWVLDGLIGKRKLLTLFSVWRVETGSVGGFSGDDGAVFKKVGVDLDTETRSAETVMAPLFVAPESGGRVLLLVNGEQL